MGQTINLNNQMHYINNNLYGSFSPKFSLPLTCSISTKAESNFSESNNWQPMKIYNNNNVNELMSPIGRIPSNLFTPIFGNITPNQNNFHSCKTFPKSTKNSKNVINKFKNGLK